MYNATLFYLYIKKKRYILFLYMRDIKKVMPHFHFHKTIKQKEHNNTIR